MDDNDKIKQLFTDFEPELSPDSAFMTRLQHNLNAVEVIRQQNADLKVRGKIAIAIAACVGFVVGFIFSLILPYINTVIAALQRSLPTDSAIKTVVDNYLIIAWLIIGCTVVYTSLHTYNLSLSLLRKNECAHLR